MWELNSYLEANAPGRDRLEALGLRGGADSGEGGSTNGCSGHGGTGGAAGLGAGHGGRRHLRGGGDHGRHFSIGPQK